MTDILIPDFTGTNGASFVDGTPSGYLHGGTAATYDNDVPPGYSSFQSMEVDLATGSSTNQFNFTGVGDAWVSWYFNWLATSAAAALIHTWFNSGTKIGDIRLAPGAQTFELRDASASKFTTPTIALNTWHRAALHIQPGSATGHRLKLFLGANRDGATPDVGYDSGTQACTAAAQTAVESWRFGLIAGTEVHMRIARVRIATSEPAGITGGGGGTGGSAIYAARSGAWV